MDIVIGMNVEIVWTKFKEFLYNNCIYFEIILLLFVETRKLSATLIGQGSLDVLHENTNYRK